MAEQYEQFLGTRPGVVVELIDDSSSPYVVRTGEGFEFSVSAEDFRSYYRKLGEATPQRWKSLLTDPEVGLVESQTVARLMSVLHSFEQRFGDSEKARSWARDALTVLEADPGADMKRFRGGLKERGRDPDNLTEKDLKMLRDLPEQVRTLLLSSTWGGMPLIDLPPGPDYENGPSSDSVPVSVGRRTSKAPAASPVSLKKKATNGISRGMKNIELSLQGDIMTITIDLSQEFGPSKSGKTIIIASSQGNKTVPGREEKIGLNVYRQEKANPTKGRRTEFKNVVMSVDGDLLRVTVDLSKEFGPSKSGQTTIVASTEGNQLVYGRSEKIGLNVYRKIE